MSEQNISRRNALKSALAAAAVPALPAAAFANLGSKPIHSEADFRAALEAYLSAYVAFYRPDDDYDAYDFNRMSFEESLEFDKYRQKLCNAWSDSRERLVSMVMENHGRDPEEDFLNVASLSVDFPDVSFVATGHEEHEGEGDGQNVLAIVPRSPELRRRLESLPQWEPDSRDPGDKEPITWDARRAFHENELRKENEAMEDDDD